MNSYVASILIGLNIFLLVAREYDIDPLCDCYSVSLTSVFLLGASSDQTICYTYSFAFNSENIKCQNNGINMVLGVCDTNDDETQFTSKSLQESIVSITPNQDISILSQSTETDSLFGLKLAMNKEVTLCMKDVNTEGITGENVEFILNNDDTIRCYYDPKQSGLPCKSSISVPPIIESQKNMEYPEFERIDISNNFDELISNDNEFEKKSKGISVTARSYIRFAFVFIMIFIVCNVLFCVLLALRQSGALDDVKYFNMIEDDDDNEDEHIDDDIDEEYVADDDDYSDDISPIYNNMHMNDVRVSDLVAMRSGHSINDSNFKIMISLSKLEENRELHGQLNDHSSSEHHPFME